jgi:hypothetical protein
MHLPRLVPQGPFRRRQPAQIRRQPAQIRHPRCQILALSHFQHPFHLLTALQNLAPSES